MKTAFVAGVLFASLLPAISQAPTVFQPCDNVLPHEPILLYEVTGSTIATQVDRTLIVFADGSMKLSAASATGQGKCAAGHTSRDNARALQLALTQAGAFAMCDDMQQVTDVPLRTLTIMRGAQDARAHTFSYWLGAGEYATVDALLENFIAEEFPDF